MYNVPDNTDELIDSRDVIERMQELLDAIEDNDTSFDDTECYEHCHELRLLGELGDDATDYADDWEDGVVLVRDSFWTEWAQQDAEDIYELPTEGPASYIDWEAYARDLQMDYTGVEFDGVTYWTR